MMNYERDKNLDSIINKEQDQKEQNDPEDRSYRNEIKFSSAKHNISFSSYYQQKLQMSAKRAEVGNN